MVGDYLPISIFNQIKAELEARNELQAEIDKKAKELRALRDKKRQHYTFTKIAKKCGVKHFLVEKINYEIVINE